MKILVAPLNWGLGHASRCVPLVRQLLTEGNEVLIGGDGESLLLLKKQFPELRTIELTPLNLRYSKRSSQIGAMLIAVLKIIRFICQEQKRIMEVQDRERFDRIISDNRFGLWCPNAYCIYMTHQLHIRLPKGLRCLETIASRAHAFLYRKYSEIWVPDVEKNGLSGALGHPETQDPRVRYIGPLSRWEGMEAEADESYDVVAVLSGLEPQRSLLEQEIENRYIGRTEQVLIVRGKMGGADVKRRHANITRVERLPDKPLLAYMRGAKVIIARSGYSTIMDLHVTGLMDKTELIPTPGQPEQEYLAEWLKEKNGGNDLPNKRE